MGPTECPGARATGTVDQLLQDVLKTGVRWPPQQPCCSAAILRMGLDGAVGRGNCPAGPFKHWRKAKLGVAADSKGSFE